MLRYLILAAVSTATVASAAGRTVYAPYFTVNGLELTCCVVSNPSPKPQTLDWSVTVTAGSLSSGKNNGSHPPTCPKNQKTCTDSIPLAASVTETLCFVGDGARGYMTFTALGDDGFLVAYCISPQVWDTFNIPGGTVSSSLQFNVNGGMPF